MMIMGLKRGEMLFISWMFTVFPFPFSTFTFEEREDGREQVILVCCYFCHWVWKSKGIINLKEKIAHNAALFLLLKRIKGCSYRLTSKPVQLNDSTESVKSTEHDETDMIWWDD